MRQPATKHASTRITTGAQANSSVIGLADGGWLVAWQIHGQDGDDWHLPAALRRRWRDGGAETHVSTHTTGVQNGANVTALADGGWVVTWVSQGQDGDLYGIYQQRYHANGDAFGNETPVNTYTTDNQSAPSTTALSDGGWVVTWQSTGSRR